jgi:hypothetical protein
VQEFRWKVFGLSVFGAQDVLMNLNLNGKYRKYCSFLICYFIQFGSLFSFFVLGSILNDGLGVGLQANMVADSSICFKDTCSLAINKN